MKQDTRNFIDLSMVGTMWHPDVSMDYGTAEFRIRMQNHHNFMHDLICEFLDKSINKQTFSLYLVIR